MVSVLPVVFNASSILYCWQANSSSNFRDCFPSYEQEGTLDLYPLILSPKRLLVLSRRVCLYQESLAHHSRVCENRYTEPLSCLLGSCDIPVHFIKMQQLVQVLCSNLQSLFQSYAYVLLLYTPKIVYHECHVLYYLWICLRIHCFLSFQGLLLNFIFQYIWV